MRALLRGSVGLLGLIAACSRAASSGDDEMPEANAPIDQLKEAGPLAEGYLDRAAIRARFVTDGSGRLTSEAIALPGPASRAAVWLGLSRDSETPRVEVQAGWSSGQSGPWIELFPVWSEARQRILAVSLGTAATRLRIRVAASELDAIETLWWTADVPLARTVRQAALPDLPPEADSVASPRSAWRAELARCGDLDPAIDRVILYRIPAPSAGEDVALSIRATQALDQLGREWCDVRANYFVEEGGSWTGRGARRSAYAIEGDDAGRISVALLGCDAPMSGARSAQLSSLLSELVRRYGLSSADRFEVGASPACPSTSDGAWLVDALAAWTATDPFDPTMMTPPSGEGAIHGRVWDASTGDEATGTGIGAAAIVCDCGLMTTSDAAGAWTLSVPTGTQRITFIKSGFTHASRSVLVAAGGSVDLPIGLEPVTPPDHSVRVIDQSFLIRHFGGDDVDPMTFPETTDGFQAYLDAVGVRHFSALEYVTPHNLEVAHECGYTILLPERDRWRKGAALGLLADVLRDLVQEPITLRNWWRPDCYNTGVGGEPNGDHPDADALDLDFQSAPSRAAAQRYLCETYWDRDILTPDEIAPGSNLDPRLNMSVGLGDITIHLGLLSTNGRRFWKYASYTAQASSGDCW
jgi:hypothetical protein